MFKSKSLRIRTSPEGFRYLNIGCGKAFSAEWTNVDLYPNDYVDFHDLRKSLPFPDDSFDAVYSSHVLEHFSPSQGEQMLRDVYRVLKAGGVCRIVVPDLEEICRCYLSYLAECLSDFSEHNLTKYYWMTMELLDQLVREEPGGLMLQVVRDGACDKEFVQQRLGDELVRVLETELSPSPPARDFIQKLYENVRFKHLSAKRLWWLAKCFILFSRNPRKTGEAHKWMYDRLSLRLLLEKTGFAECSIKSFLESEIPNWGKYQLDTSVNGERPRKPDSIYLEGRKTRD